MRIVVPVVVDMTDPQVAEYAADSGIGTRAKDVVASVRSYVLTAVQESPALAGTADVTLKGR